MPLQPAIQGDQHTGQLITWYSIDPTVVGGVSPKDLTGAVLSGTITDPDGNTRAITGVLTVTNAIAGQFKWAYGSGDTAVVGQNVVQITATYPDTLKDTSFEMEWPVKVKR